MQVTEGVQGGFNMASRGHLQGHHGLRCRSLRGSKVGSTWLQEAIFKVIMAFDESKMGSDGPR